MGRHFTIKTDHQSLRFLLDQQSHTPAQQQWILKMMGYDYDVCYRKGSSNKVADALSRKPMEALHMVTVLHTDLLAKIQHSWEHDANVSRVIQQLQQPSNKPSKFTWEANQLRRKGKLVVGMDLALRQELLEFFHSSVQEGHSGVQQTMARICAVVYWKGLKKHVRQFVRECNICQQCKYDTTAKPGLLQPLPIPKTVWTDIAMDFIEGLPKSARRDVIMVVVDRLSKYAHFIALSHPFTAIDVAQAFMNEIYRLHGIPNSIVSDRDKVFLSNFWQELFKHMGTTLKMSTAYHPQTDGQSEVVNRCLESYLRCMVHERPKDWARWLPLAEWWYNTTFHSSINTTPYAVVYGQPAPVHMPYLPGDSKVASVDRSLQTREAAIKLLKFSLERASHRMKQHADRKRSDRQFSVGDMVYLKLQPYRQKSVVNRLCLKLSARFFGPYKVLEKIGAVAYKLDLPATSKIHPVFHVSQLKQHVGKLPVQSQLPLLDSAGLLVKEPVQIMDRRMRKSGNAAITEVLIRWSNTFPEDATWESWATIQRDFPHFNP